MKKTAAIILLAIVPILFFGGALESVKLPILMYHHVVPDVKSLDGNEDSTVFLSSLEDQVRILAELGYVTVSFDEVIDFVEGGGTLPDKPVCIVFDDGYRSFYDHAFGLFQQYGVKSTVCIIGSLVGADLYKDSGAPIIPHFDWNEAEIMNVSGIVEFASHTYNFHARAEFEDDSDYHVYAVKNAGETDADFSKLFCTDMEKMECLMNENLGYPPYVFAYPHGKYDELSESLLEKYGYKVTLSTDQGTNRIVRGDRKCLFLMKRYNINCSTDKETFLKYITN